MKKKTIFLRIFFVVLSILIMAPPFASGMEAGSVAPQYRFSEAELDQMLKEHKEIVARLKILTEAALKENKLEYVQFAEKLALHAQTEEEVLYPAAILVGKYLETKL